MPKFNSSLVSFLEFISHRQAALLCNVRKLCNERDERLFRPLRPMKVPGRDCLITEDQAMRNFCLGKEHLCDLPSSLPRKSIKNRLELFYAVADVRKRAMEIHGSEEVMRQKRRSIIDLKHNVHMNLILENIRRERIAISASNRVVCTALVLNMCDACSKYIAAYFTGSKSLFAEGVHSTMDTLNQVILLLGIRVSKRNPDKVHPYGYGNMRYVSSLISGCAILSFGCGLSVYHGVSGLLNPSSLNPLAYGYIALTLSLIFQGASALYAFRTTCIKAKAAKLSPFNYIRISSDPTLNVVLLEDSAAVIGVLIALASFALSAYSNSPIPDSVGSILIGLILGIVSTFIIRTNITYLMGQALPPETTESMVYFLCSDPSIRSIHDVKATFVGVDQMRFKAEIYFNGQAITRKYLNERCDMKKMLEKLKTINSEEELEEFLLDHGEKIVGKLGGEIDRLEIGLLKRYPSLRYVDLESV